MNPTIRTWSIVTVAAVLVAFAGGWFLLIAPARSDSAELRTQAAALNGAAARNNAALAQLVEQAKALPQKAEEFASLRQQVPLVADLPGMVREFSAAATAADVDLTSISPAAPVAVTSMTSGAAATTPDATSPAGLQGITVSLSVQGNFFAIQDYLRRLEGLQRAVLVSGVTVQDAPSGTASPGEVSGTITAHVFFSSGASATLPSTASLTSGSTS